jgi:acyl-CoA reductase-like NAD-dependent aldehyde dehydrogenase
MASARLAQNRWSKTPLIDRLKLVRKLRQLIAGHALWLAEASASERQRPTAESLTAEVLPLAEACRFLERNAETTLGPKRLGRRGLPLWLTGVRSEISREPLGIVLIIGPGNYPLLLPGVQIVQTLVAGNAVLLKPGVGGTRAAQALCELMVRAGFDAQLVAQLPETSEAARVAIFTHPDKVLFTGSAATGEKVLAQLAPHLIPATMELSGCDAVIIRPDADLDLAVKALVFGLTLNAGATCLSPKRVFVDRRLAREVEGRLAKVFRGMNPDMRTLVPENSLEKLRPLIYEALAQGAHFIAGEIRHKDTMIAPIILAGVSPNCRLLREDIFVPVLSIVTVSDDLEAVMRANDCPFALTASIFSRDEPAARSLASRIHAGVVTINDLILPTGDARLPFGGRGRSGFGLTRGAEGLLELTAPKVVSVSRGKFRPAFERAQPGDETMFQAYLQFTHGKSLKARWMGLVSIIKTISQRKNPKEA